MNINMEISLSSRISNGDHHTLTLIYNSWNFVKILLMKFTGWESS